MQSSKSLFVIPAALVMAALFFPLTAEAATTKKEKPVPYGAPIELRIPRVGIKASVEQTSVDKKGILIAPKNPKQVGWYRNGTIPGKRGNALMAGHVDWYDGPAAFWKLRYVRRGDIVEVKNDYGRVLRFRVVNIGYYYNGSVPLNRIVGPTKKYALNLYTCTGSYNRSDKNYSHRVVVFTELIR